MLVVGTADMRNICNEVCMNCMFVVVVFQDKKTATIETLSSGFSVLPLYIEKKSQSIFENETSSL